MAEKKIEPGMTVHLNTAKSGVFDDSLSGLRLDIFDGGEKGVIPDCSEEKLVVIKKALEHGLLLLDSDPPDQGVRRINIVDTSANFEAECAEVLLCGREKLTVAIAEENGLDRLRQMLVLEEKDKARVYVIRLLKARINALKSELRVEAEEVEPEFQVTNIIEPKNEEAKSGSDVNPVAPVS